MLALLLNKINKLTVFVCCGMLAGCETLIFWNCEFPQYPNSRKVLSAPIAFDVASDSNFEISQLGFRKTSRFGCLFSLRGKLSTPSLKKHGWKVDGGDLQSIARQFLSFVKGDFAGKKCKRYELRFDIKETRSHRETVLDRLIPLLVSIGTDGKAMRRNFEKCFL